jgi:hypothetical protein
VLKRAAAVLCSEQVESSPHPVSFMCGVNILPPSALTSVKCSLHFCFSNQIYARIFTNSNMIVSDLVCMILFSLFSYFFPPLLLVHFYFSPFYCIFNCLSFLSPFLFLTSLILSLSLPI